MTGKATRDIDEMSGIIIDGNIKLIKIRFAACGEILTVVKIFCPFLYLLLMIHGFHQ